MWREPFHADAEAREGKHDSSGWGGAPLVGAPGGGTIRDHDVRERAVSAAHQPTNFPWRRAFFGGSLTLSAPAQLGNLVALSLTEF
jgi:hypothetical protein